MNIVPVLAMFIWALGIRTFLYQPFSIPSVAMEPSVNVGDYLFAEKFAYRDRHPERGDIIVFHVAKLQADFIKRVAGLPGDTVQMRDGILFVNNHALPQHRVADFVEMLGDQTHHVAQYEETFPGGRVGHILDRERDGPEDNTGVYTVPPGHYFVLGDNRDNSDDSRMEVGYVPQSAIIGRPVLKFFAHGHPVLQSVN